MPITKEIYSAPSLKEDVKMASEILILFGLKFCKIFYAIFLKYFLHLKIVVIKSME